MSVAKFLITLLRLGNSGVNLATPPQPAIGMAYIWRLLPTGPTAPYKLAIVGDLPPGLSYVAERQRITGTPTAAGTWPISVTATGRNRVPVVFHYTLVVLPLALQLVGALVGDVLGQPVTGSLVARGGSGFYTLHNPPTNVPGIAFSMAGGVITASGSIASVATYSLLFLVADSAGLAVAFPYSLRVGVTSSARHYVTKAGAHYVTKSGAHYVTHHIED